MTQNALRAKVLVVLPAIKADGYFVPQRLSTQISNSDHENRKNALEVVYILNDICIYNSSNTVESIREILTDLSLESMSPQNTSEHVSLK